MTPRITLEQWRALIAVHDHGGYAQAAAALNKSQSTVSYAVHRIEDLLDVRAFERQGRKAHLTAAGQMLVRRARALIEEAERLERAAALAAGGWETELRVAAEVIFPTWRMLDCLDRLCRAQPGLRVQLHESVLGGTAELLTSGRVDLAIASSIPAGFIGDPLTRVRFIAAAAPDHALHRLNRPLTAEDLRRHRHLVVRDSATQPAGSQAPRASDQRWTVTAKATSIAAACRGYGFAWYAEDIIRSELDSGALKPLPLAHGAERWATLYLVYADPDSAGPAARALADLLRSAAA
ncbi:LysR family transcriptional regulator [Wenzhouxiangella limi]|uniref:LysR family transcriptional regulator n=1 Tax=Wenzhouxiangella limi TaxID=2707351 RepID=A0A845V092_9GAMM|nr:LysR family transcriptional regulator [Wenzhouxiangella limi]NDY95620.1 LysR family transcriptional regulator [Wenzhouxiangella limi]